MTRDTAACPIARWCSITVLSTLILVCSRCFNVNSLMGDIFAEQLAGDLIVEHQQIDTQRRPNGYFSIFRYGRAV